TPWRFAASRIVSPGTACTSAPLSLNAIESPLFIRRNQPPGHQGTKNCKRIGNRTHGAEHHVLNPCLSCHIELLFLFSWCLGALVVRIWLSLWSSSCGKYFITVSTGLGAACPSPQMEASAIACESSVSRSRFHALVSMSCNAFALPTRQGVHWPQDSS